MVYCLSKSALGLFLDPLVAAFWKSNSENSVKIENSALESINLFYLRKLVQPIRGYTHNGNFLRQQHKHHHDGMDCCGMGHDLLCKTIDFDTKVELDFQTFF